MDDAEQGRIPRWRRVLGAAALVGLVKRLDKTERDADEPRAVFSNAKVSALRDRAMELAANGREDDAAVEELRRAARGHRTRLDHTAALVRFGGFHHEHRIVDRANRLLVAAASDEPIAVVTAAQDHLFAEVERLVGMSRADGFTYLAARKPELNVLRDRIVERARGRVHASGAVDDEVIWDELIDALAPLVGPESQTTDALLRSRFAFGVARVGIADQAGLTFFD